MKIKTRDENKIKIDILVLTKISDANFGT